METTATAATWPADVIHVNEDGWVLINPGHAQGVTRGLRLFVVGTGIRELRDLFPAAGASQAPPVLRTRRTYELLEVVHVEAQCAIAVAARAPLARRPQFYRGPDGELLVWVPLPDDYTWPLPENAEADVDTSPESLEATNEDSASDDEAQDDDAPDAAEVVDAPPEHADQEDQRWEEALPLNGVSVGDRVVPAVAIQQPETLAEVASATARPVGESGAAPDPAHWDRHYDWMKPAGE